MSRYHTGYSGGPTLKHDKDPERPADELVADALDRYRKGRADLKEAAEAVGLQEWEFLEAAQSTPDPVAGSWKQGLPTFVRDRR